MTNRIEVADHDDAEDAEAVICIRLTSPLVFPDNLIDLCSRCGEAIQHRPHVPKLPPKVCQECIKPDLERESAKGEMTVMITPKTAMEVAVYIHKKNAN